MTKISLNDLASLTNEQSALITLNSNNLEIETKSDDFLSRTGVSPNEMQADLDMNSNSILNLPQPVTATEPLRLQDLNDFIGGGTISTFPNDASYVTLATNASLAQERVLTAGSNIDIVDGGAGGNVTVSTTGLQPLDGDLTAVAALSSTGLATRTAANTWTTRSITQPAAGITVSNSDGVAGNPTLALANDLAAVEGLSSNGLIARTATDTMTTRTITQPAAGITVTNGDGVSGNPTLALANDLAALEGLSGTGIAVHTGTSTWTERSLTQPAAGITISNNTGVAGNPTFALANDLNALEGLSSNGLIARTATDTMTTRTITQPAAGITVTNGDGVSGNPTLALANDLASLESYATTLTIPYRSATDTWGPITIGDELYFVSGTLDVKGHMPGGRLTLQTGTPVMTTTQSAKTTIYWSPYIHQFAPLYDGSQFIMKSMGGELSQLTTDTTKSPAAVGNNLNYDLFLWSDSGTMRCTRGPAWSSDTSRGTGAGTTELTRVQGILLNANNITNGPAAQRGTYVGTVRSNGSAQIDFIIGGTATGGTAGFVGIWNNYHRVPVITRSMDDTDSWNYTTLTYRSANNSTAMRASFVIGQAEDCFQGMYKALSTNNTASPLARVASIGYDSTSASDGSVSHGFSQLNAATFALIDDMVAVMYKPHDIGFHFIQALETSVATNTTTWFGDGGSPTLSQNGLFYSGRY